ncbi:MAG: hypothetical protein GXP24_12065 [Planctomycetes bacterium]|nr:hypothetical protein [Planctomycetota bacterium]
MSSDTQHGTPKKYQLTVNTYDRTATLLIALLILVGAAVSGLLVVFFASRQFPSIEPIPVVPVEATSANANQGLADEPDPPGVEDAPDLTEPQLQDTLDALTAAVSMNEVLLSDEMIDAEKEAGKGKGLGDSRMAGPGGDGVVERVPRWQRWKIRFEPDSAGDFAQWLDYHKIEIGVLGRDNQVHYAYELGSSSPKSRTGDPRKETRGYTSAADGPMPSLTNLLARKADIARHGTVVLLFYPFEVESILYTFEKKYAEQHNVTNVNALRETVFTVVKERGKYTFQVIDQKYF